MMRPAGNLRLGRWVPLLVLALGVEPDTAFARRLAGLQVSVTAATRLRVSYDVTAYVAGGNAPPAQFQLGGALDQSLDRETTTAADFGLGFAPTNYQVFTRISADHQTTPLPAIEFGDGQTLPTATLALQGVGAGPGGTHVYRGSFSHTFPDPGTFTLTATAGPSGDLGEPGLGRATLANPAFPPFVGDASVGALVLVTKHQQEVARAAAPNTRISVSDEAATLTYAQTVRHLTHQQQLVLPLCAAAPIAGCRSAGKSTLSITDAADDAKDAITFNWIKGSLPLSAADFGNPLTTTDYALCVYSGGTLINASEAPAGTPGWSSLKGKGFGYAAKSALPGGLTKLLLKGGAAGTPKVSVKGKGAPLPFPGSFLPVAAPVNVTAQLVANDGSNCFSASFSDAGVKKNEAPPNKAAQFKAAGDAGV